MRKVPVLYRAELQGLPANLLTVRAPGTAFGIPLLHLGWVRTSDLRLARSIAQNQ